MVIKTILKEEEMAKVPEELLYTKDHEWVKIDGDIATMGITDYAQDELGDIVFFELRDAGDSVNEGDSLGTVEAVKAVSEIYAPISGIIEEINESLADSPEIVNSEPYEGGWIAKIKIDDEKEIETLLSVEEYKELIG